MSGPGWRSRSCCLSERITVPSFSTFISSPVQDFPLGSTVTDPPSNIRVNRCGTWMVPSPMSLRSSLYPSSYLHPVVSGGGRWNVDVYRQPSGKAIKYARKATFWFVFVRHVYFFRCYYPIVSNHLYDVNPYDVSGCFRNSTKLRYRV